MRLEQTMSSCELKGERVIYVVEVTCNTHGRMYTVGVKFSRDRSLTEDDAITTYYDKGADFYVKSMLGKKRSHGWSDTPSVTDQFYRTLKELDGYQTRFLLQGLENRLTLAIGRPRKG